MMLVLHAISSVTREFCTRPSVFAIRQSQQKHQLKWKQCTVSDLGEQDQLDQRQTWYEYESGSAEDEESVQPIKYRGLG
jgi:N-acyl-L-homoserine lactone synthetase